MKKEICHKFDLNPKRVGVYSSGVSTLVFNPENYVDHRIELRRRLGLSNKFIVFYHGNFQATRGLYETLEAILTVKNVYPNVVFFLLGTGPILSNLKKIINKRSIKDNVIIHDPVDYTEVPKFISMSDVCIVPLPNISYWKFQCPLKLLEYLAMKKVVIVTDIPAHRSVIRNEKCGIYLSSVKPFEIAKSIIYVYENKENLEKWGESGRRIVDKKYTWEKVAKDLENYLLKILSRSAHAFSRSSRAYSVPEK